MTTRESRMMRMRSHTRHRHIHRQSPIANRQSSIVNRQIRWPPMTATTECHLRKKKGHRWWWWWWWWWNIHHTHTHTHTHSLSLSLSLIQQMHAMERMAIMGINAASHSLPTNNSAIQHTTLWIHACNHMWPNVRGNRNMQACVRRMMHVYPFHPSRVAMAHSMIDIAALSFRVLFFRWDAILYFLSPLWLCPSSNPKNWLRLLTGSLDLAEASVDGNA